MLDATNAIDHFVDLRRMMVDCQVRPFDVTDQAVLNAMLDVPREKFVGAENAAIAYSDAPLTLLAGEKRQLLAPMVLARLIQAADITPGCRVLDVAGAAGYSAAILAKLAGRVVALESDPAFTARATALFAELGIVNAHAITGALDSGGAGQGPFDVILVNGVIERGLEGLLASLAPGGRLVAIQRSAGQSGKAVRYDAVAGNIGSRTLFEATGSILAPFASRPTFAF